MIPNEGLKTLGSGLGTILFLLGQSPFQSCGVTHEQMLCDKTPNPGIKRMADAPAYAQQRSAALVSEATLENTVFETEGGLA